MTLNHRHHNIMNALLMTLNYRHHTVMKALLMTLIQHHIFHESFADDAEPPSPHFLRVSSWINRVGQAQDDDELMLNVLRCHLTY